MELPGRPGNISFGRPKICGLVGSAITFCPLDSFRNYILALPSFEERTPTPSVGFDKSNEEFQMKKLIIATAALGLMCSSAFAQNSTGPAPQSDNMQKPGMNNMDKGSMSKETTGMNKEGMAKGGMMKPDASGQGGSGPGSDQGGTKSNMK